MSARAQDADFPEKFDNHPAYRAWRGVNPGAHPPSRIEHLQGTLQHRIVFRLYDVGSGSAVIAKGSRRPGIKVERVLYEQVLSRMALSTPGYFGFVEEEDGLCWIFLQDAGDEPLMTSDAAHRAAAARWLAALHLTAAELNANHELSDRGPGYYLTHLKEGRARIMENLDHPDFGAEDKAMLKAIVELCDEVESGWRSVLSFCDGQPQSMAHGDFQPKNIRVREQGDGLALVVFDWEKAGWGIPAPDLAPNIFHDEKQVDLALYGDLVASRWPELSPETLSQLAEVGLLFRLLASIDWASQSLSFPAPEKPLAQLQIYLDELDRLLRRRVWL